MKVEKKKKAETRRIEDILNNPSDKKKLQNFIDEAVRCKTKIADEQESIKGLREEAVEQVGVEGKIFNALVTLFFKNNFAEKQQEIETLDNAIDMLMMNRSDD